MPISITLNAVHTHYGLHGPLDLSLSGSGIVCLIGPNGAGKSTLLRVLCGSLPLVSGERLLSGAPLEALSNHDRARQIAFMPQSAPLSPHWTVSEVLQQGLTPYHRSHIYGEVKRELDHLCQVFELNEFLMRPILELSGGERQRVLIVRALAQSTGLIILDEPFTALDWSRQEKLAQEVRAVCKRRNSLLILSIHELNLAALYADQLILMSQGHIKAQGSPSDLMSSEELDRAFRTHARRISHPTHSVQQILPWGPQ